MLALIVHVIKGKSYEPVVLLILVFLFFGGGMLAVWFGVGDGYILQPNVFAPSLICVLRLGDIWEKRKK